MSNSVDCETPAIGLREAKRRDTMDRIVDKALALTAAHGFDGFTVDELATAAGVSRRTFFNYFPSKEDALLGNPDDMPPALTTRFLDGGPSGQLIDDLVALILTSITPDFVDPARLRKFRAVLETEHRLVPMFHKRFAARADQLAELIAGREDLPADAPRTQLAVDIVGALVGRAFRQFAAVDNTAPLADLLMQNLAVARDLLG